jgi:hypothetical protein
MYRFLLISTIVVMYVINIQIGVAEVPQMMSYQGQLTNADGVPVPDGTYELVFSLYPDSLLPDFFWQEVQEVEVTGGLFDVQLGLNVPIPFGPFLEIAPPYLYLGIAVVGNPEMLPRTMLSSGAFAIKAFHSDEAEWTLFSDAAGVAEAVADSSITGASIADGSIGLQDIGQNGASPGQIIKWTPSGWDIADDATGGSGDDGDWTISGDILFTGGKWGIARLGNVLYGNHDSTHVNLGTECTTGTAALNEWYVAVGGGYGNSATRVSSTISGGFQNRANGTGSTIGGGTANRATHTGSTVGGGGSNSANGIDATVAGGNINAADADFTIVAGGLGNQAQDTIASVLGGKYNYAYGVGSTIGGGMRNAAHGQYSFVGGGGGVSPYDSNAAIGDQSVVVGGRHNVAVDEEAAVVCGHDNSANGAQSFVGAGQINQAIGQSAVVAGGYNNVAQDMETTISGGANNIARSRQSAIGGGSYNETDAPAGYHANATVAGGHQNKALHQYATVAGGGYNEATARMAAICGGIDNHATDSAAIVCGGGSNVARGKYSAVVGGGGDYGSLDSNAALAAFSFVGGGTQNVADGDYASVLGGRDNRAQGDYSVAVGRHALALHDGCFVWADATNSSFASVRDNELAASVANGMRVEASSDMFGTYIDHTLILLSGMPGRHYMHTTSAQARPFTVTLPTVMQVISPAMSLSRDRS